MVMLKTQLYVKIMTWVKKFILHISRLVLLAWTHLWCFHCSSLCLSKCIAGKLPVTFHELTWVSGNGNMGTWNCENNKQENIVLESLSIAHCRVPFCPLHHAYKWTCRLLKFAWVSAVDNIFGNQYLQKEQMYKVKIRSNRPTQASKFRVHPRSGKVVYIDSILFLLI